MSQLVLIDLGLIGLEPAAEPIPRVRWLAAHRAVMAAATAVLLLGTAAAAAAPGPPVLSEIRVAAGLGHDARILGDHLYVVTPVREDSQVVGRTVASYRLPDAVLEWRVPLPLLDGSRWMVAAPGALLVGSETDLGPVTVALDDATGRLLWRRQAVPIGSAAAADLVLLRTPIAGTTWQDFGRHVVQAIHARTGRPAWLYPLPEAGQEAFAERGGRLTRAVTGVPSGLVEVRGLTSGALLASRQLLPPPTPGRVSRFERWLQVVGDLVVVGETGGPATAYDLDTLEPRWTADVDVPSVYLSTGCGPVICAIGRGGGIRALDAATGRLRWSTQRLAFARSFGGALVALAEGGDRTPTLEVVDPRTGYPMRELGPWRLAAGDPGAPPVAIRHDATVMRALVGTLDSDTSGVRPLGVLPDVVDGCEAGVGWVMCRHLDASIGLWRFG